MGTQKQKLHQSYLQRLTPAIVLVVFVLTASLFCFLSYIQFTEYDENKEVVSNREHQPATSLSLPKRIMIPTLFIDADILPVGRTQKGAMATVPNFKNVGWYKYGPMPGQQGSAVIGGHVDNGLGLDGVFKHLNDLQVGDDIYVDLEDGERLHFKVSYVEVYPYDTPSKEIIFGRNDLVRLNLITCAGLWNKTLKTYDKRLVVFATLVSSPKQKRL